MHGQLRLLYLENGVEILGADPRLAVASLAETHLNDAQPLTTALAQL